jgi:hypothetical protein
MSKASKIALLGALVIGAKTTSNVRRASSARRGKL